jgi:hypothetical protein
MSIDQALSTVRRHWRDDLQPSGSLRQARHILAHALGHMGDSMSTLRYREIERWHDVAVREIDAEQKGGQ